MFAFRSIVIARQLDELRAESAARRLARTAKSTDETPRPMARHPRWSEEPALVLPTLENYPYPAR